MNFESKHLIRWGIPGWIVIICYSFYFQIGGIVDFSLSQTENSKLLVSLAIGLSSGVIVGYLIYQIYFMFLWVINNKKKSLKRTRQVIKKHGIELPDTDSEQYFFIEYLWQKRLSELEEHKMKYISERYSHLLSKKHEMGSLVVSLHVCLPLSLALVTSSDLNLLYSGLFLILNVQLLNYVFNNFRYYSSNADYFMASMLDDFLFDSKTHSETISALFK